MLEMHKRLFIFTAVGIVGGLITVFGLFLVVGIGHGGLLDNTIFGEILLVLSLPGWLLSMLYSNYLGLSSGGLWPVLFLFVGGFLFYFVLTWIIYRFIGFFRLNGRQPVTKLRKEDA